MTHAHPRSPEHILFLKDTGSGGALPLTLESPWEGDSLFGLCTHPPGQGWLLTLETPTCPRPEEGAELLKEAPGLLCPSLSSPPQGHSMSLHGRSRQILSVFTKVHKSVTSLKLTSPIRVFQSPYAREPLLGVGACFSAPSGADPLPILPPSQRSPSSLCPDPWGWIPVYSWDFPKASLGLFLASPPFQATHQGS